MNDLNSKEIKASIAEIQEFYRGRAYNGKYATSPDFHLREVEIHHISRYVKSGLRILDAGCGNGYTTLCLASMFDSNFSAIDFVPEMIEGAKKIERDFSLVGQIDFTVGDVTQLEFPDESFDICITERCLLNLPSREAQKAALVEISRVLKPGGRYLMLEGTLQGLEKLNVLRTQLGLEAIPDAESKTNWFSNKFDEAELTTMIVPSFSKILGVERFGTYFLISRIVHPLLVQPEQPRYDAKINDIAERIAKLIPDFGGMGHVALWVLEK